MCIRDRQLEDLTRNAGKHAGGVVIAPSPLSDFSPLYAEHDHGLLGKNPVTQFDKDDVEAVGLVKFDFLGLRTPVSYTHLDVYKRQALHEALRCDASARAAEAVAEVLPP